MTDLPFIIDPKLVQRKDALHECGAVVGYLNIKIQNSPNDFDTVAFRCTKPRGHRDQFNHEFVGADLIVRRK